MMTDTATAKSPLRGAPAALVTVMMAAVTAGCEREVIDEEALPDFFVTVQLTQKIQPQAIDRLEVILGDSSVLLDDGSGAIFDGEISWETRDSLSGDVFAIEVAGEFFQRNTIVVPGDLYELDIPFIGGMSGPEVTVRVEARGYWLDEDDEEQEIGFGTNVVDFPVERSSTVTVELDCPERDWAWTCRTGCREGLNECPAGVDQCDAGQDCVDGCCVD